MPKHPLQEYAGGRILVSPSVLAANFAELGAELKNVTAAGADLIHLDIMDGHFVPNLTIGPAVVAALRKHSCLPFDVHLMISHPLQYVEDFAKAGADHITFHIESDDDPVKTIEAIHATGCSAGITLKPNTPDDALNEVLPLVEMVLVMTVEPGFGGQTFRPEQLEKVTRIRARLKEIGSNAHIEVDGGLDESNVNQAAAAGANVIVAGTSVFRHPKGLVYAVERLHDAQKSLVP